jgi:hypothetical protein
VKLYRDSATGIAWVEDGNTGSGHSCHSHIDASGSVRGMRDRGYWGKHDRAVRSRGWIYNIDRLNISGRLDEIAQAYCRCDGRHEEGAELRGPELVEAERRAAELVEAERRVEFARWARRRRRFAPARPHGLCESRTDCAEHARDASVPSCK